MITQKEIARKDFNRVCEINDYEVFTEKQVQGYISHVKGIIQKSEVDNLSENEVESINTFNEDLPELHKAIVLNDDLSRELVFYRERKVIFEDTIEKSEGTDIEKATRTGRYANTHQNRKLNRVGQKYVERKKKVGTEEEKKKGKNNVWSKDQEGKVAQNDKEFQAHLKKEGIDRYSKEASDAWKQGGFRDKQKKVFEKDKKEQTETPRNIKSLDGKEISSPEEWEEVRNNSEVKKVSNKGVLNDNGKVKHEIIFNDKSSIVVWN